MSLIPKPELRKCDTGEINCFICVGRDNCTQYASAFEITINKIIKEDFAVDERDI